MKEEPTISKKEKRLLAKDRRKCKNCINFIELRSRKDIGVCVANNGFYGPNDYCVLFKDKEAINKAIGDYLGIKPTLIEWWAYKDDWHGGSICMSAHTKEEVENFIADHPSYCKDYAPKAFYRYPNFAEDLNIINHALNKLFLQIEIVDIVAEVNKIAFRNNMPIGMATGLATAQQWCEAMITACNITVEEQK